MFCPTCGCELPEDSVFCPVCGTKVTDTDGTVEKDEFFEDVRPAQSAQPVQPAQSVAQPAEPDKRTDTNTLALVGFILSFFSGIPALICSIMGFRKCKEYVGEKGKGLAIAGIVLSSIRLFAIVAGFFIRFVLVIVAALLGAV